MACNCLMCIAEGDNSPHRRRQQPPYLVKRAVAFRVPRLIGDQISHWQLYDNEHEAYSVADTNGVDYEALYNRNGEALVAEWQPINTAPKDKNAMFLVCAVGDDRGPFVVRADILWQARKAGTPSHLGLSYITHWMPLPAPPSPQDTTNE